MRIRIIAPIPRNKFKGKTGIGIKMATSMLEPGIFNNPRPKRSLLPNPNKKRKTEHKVEEISFDDTAREDYLTGFHKRKVERAKRAKAEAEKKMREERVVVRKQVCNLHWKRIGLWLMLGS